VARKTGTRSAQERMLEIINFTPRDEESFAAYEESFAA
jgi:hypothetical protein